MTTPPRPKPRRRAAALLGAFALVASGVSVGLATAGHSLGATKTGVAVDAKVKPIGEKTVRLKIGAARRTMPEQDLRKVKLPKGSYQVSMNGLFNYESGATYAYLGCLVIDKRLVAQIGDPDPDYSLLHLLDNLNYDTWDSIIDHAAVITLNKARTIIYGCTGSSDSSIEQLTPFHVHFTKLDGIETRGGSDYTLPTRPAHGRGLENLLR